jgi:hypothetical protein
MHSRQSLSRLRTVLAVSACPQRICCVAFKAEGAIGDTHSPQVLEFDFRVLAVRACPQLLGWIMTRQVRLELSRDGRS